MKTQQSNISEVASRKVSDAMRIIGSISTPKKAKAARRNGKKGGRPINPDSERQKKIKKRLDNTQHIGYTCFM